MNDQAEASGYPEAPPLMPGWFLLSGSCLDEVGRAWSKIGARLTAHPREWVRFIVQLDAESWQFQKARKPSAKAPDLSEQRRKRKQRHAQIAKAADRLAALIAAEIADSSQAAPDLQEKLGSVDLSILADAVSRIASAARSDKRSTGKYNGRPRSTADREDFVVSLARICREAGGKPSRSNAFWAGIAAINRELPPLARISSVSGLAEKARKGKWLSKR